MSTLHDGLQVALEFARDVWGFGGIGRGLAQFARDASLASAGGALASAYLIACTWLCAARITRWLLPRSGLPLYLSSVFGVGMWLATAGFHLLIALHAFRLPFALLGCTLLTGLVLRLLPLPRGFLRREWRSWRALYTCAKRSRYRALTGLFALFAALIALRSVVIPPLGWDTTTYHGPRAALWVSSGQFTFDDGAGAYNFYRLFFSGGEIFSAWAMLPFHSDLLANLASVFQWLGVFLGSWALARALGLREPFAATSAGVVMFLPAVQMEVNSGYVELALNAALLQGCALAVSCLRRPAAGKALLCALSLGVAAGVKLPGVPPALIIASAAALRLLFTRKVAWAPKLMAAGVGSLCALLPPLPFMLQAYRATGYPLSPMPVHAFGHTFGVASAMVQWYQARPKLAPYTWPAEKQALQDVFSPLARFNESLGTLSVIPLLLLPIGLFALARRRPVVALVLLCAAIAPVLAHFGPELSAVRLARAPSSTRFLLPTMALVIPISSCWCSPGGALSQLYRRCLLVYPLTVCCLAFKRGFGDWEYGELCGMGLIALIWGTGLGWLYRRPPLRAAGARALSGLALWVLALVLLQVRRDHTRELAYRHSYALHGFPRYWADGVGFVDEPGQVHRLAITGGADISSDKWFHYFFLGRRFQNPIRYISPTRDGGVAQFGPNGDLDKRADKAAWLERLNAAGITEVLTFPPTSIEQKYMDKDPEHFERLKGGHEWGVYRVKRSEQVADPQQVELKQKR